MQKEIIMELVDEVHACSQELLALMGELQAHVEDEAKKAGMPTSAHAPSVKAGCLIRILSEQESRVVTLKRELDRLL